MYHSRYPLALFKTEKSQEINDWYKIFSSRYKIAQNISDPNTKTKVKSFRGENIEKMRAYSNAFAFNSSKSVNVIAYSYTDSSCEYSVVSEIPSICSDFLFLDQNSIVSVGSQAVSLFDIGTKNEISRFSNKIGENPHIDSLSNGLFVVVSKTNGFVYDVRDNCDTKCSFEHQMNPISIATNGNTLYIASESDISAHDIRNPRGPILWNYTIPSRNVSTYCSFGINEGVALFGSSVINLISGRVIQSSIANDIVCGSVFSNNIVVCGCRQQEVLFYDYQKGGVIDKQEFGAKEAIKCVHVSTMNNTIAIGGSFTIRLYSSSLQNGKVQINGIRTVSCGSVGLRTKGDDLLARQVLYDGERLVTNMGSFVRVYDYFLG